MVSRGRTQFTPTVKGGLICKNSAVLFTFHCFYGIIQLIYKLEFYEGGGYYEQRENDRKGSSCTGLFSSLWMDCDHGGAGYDYAETNDLYFGHLFCFIFTLDTDWVQVEMEAYILLTSKRLS